MSDMDLELGTPGVSPTLGETFVPKPPVTLKINRVAVLVAHGMGQQVPYETIDGVAQAVERGAKGAGTLVGKSTIRTARLGIRGNGDVEPELVRAEMRVKDTEGREYEVHIYEAYWAPLTEGKVSITDVMRFLWDAGWNGFRNTECRTYRRWMFGAEQQFLLKTERLTLVFLGIMALLAALVFINSIVTAAAVSHAIGAANVFPKDELLSNLTWDFVLVDIAAIWIVLGVYAFGRLKSSISAWSSIYSGACLIVLAATLMAGHILTKWKLLDYVVPGGWWVWFVQHSTIAVLLLWIGEIAGAAFARRFLVQYVGDVAAYIAAHTVSKFWEVRQQIWQTAMRVGQAVYRAQSVTTSSEPEGFLYDRIVVVGHSLGSVIGYDLLNGLALSEQVSGTSLNFAERTGMFLTLGSPLDKTAFLFRTQKDMNSKVREVGAAAVQPLITDYRYRPKEWVNLWSPEDIISGRLDFYDPPNQINAKKPEFFRHAQANPKSVQNHIDPAAHTPLKAHVEYWDGELLARHLYRGITT